MAVRDCGSYQFVKYDSLDFIAGNRLFRYTMEVTGASLYTRDKITVRVHVRVGVFARVYVYV